MDPESGNQKRVSFDRIKLYKQHQTEVVRLDENQSDNITTDEFEHFRRELLSKLTGYQGDYREKSHELDYTK
jgi:hypothetical protein